MESNAQVYTGAVGLGLDFGDGQTLVGPSGKYFFAAGTCRPGRGIVREQCDLYSIDVRIPRGI